MIDSRELEPKFAHDLRLGNYYQYLHEEHETYHKADIDFIKIQLDFENDPNTDQFTRGWWAAPIPLTPDILEKCDFGDGFHFYDGYLYRVTVTGSHVWIAECKYLHDLQNLYYFSNNKTELTITL